MLAENALRTDKHTLAEGPAVYVHTYLPTCVSVRDELLDQPVIQRLANLRKRLEICVTALSASGMESHAT